MATDPRLGPVGTRWMSKPDRSLISRGRVPIAGPALSNRLRVSRLGVNSSTGVGKRVRVGRLTARTLDPPPAPDPAFIQGWGMPTWRDEFDYRDQNGALQVDTTKWGVWDRTLVGPGMTGTLGFLNDLSEVKASQVSVRDLGGGRTALNIRTEWLPAIIVNPAGPNDDPLGSTNIVMKTGYIDQRRLDNGNRSRFGLWEAKLWIPYIQDHSLSMLWAFWLRNGSIGEWDLCESWGFGPQNAPVVTLPSQYRRPLQAPAPGSQGNFGATTCTLHRDTNDTEVIYNGVPTRRNRKVAYTTYGSQTSQNPRYTTPIQGGRWSVVRAIWTPDVFQVYWDGVLKHSLTPASTGARFPAGPLDTFPFGPGSLDTLWTAPEMNSPWYLRMNVHPGPSPQFYGFPDWDNQDYTWPSDFQCEYVRMYAYTP